MGSKFRAYAFTINNYGDEDTNGIRGLAQRAQYIVVGKEVGDEGTPHYQGYVYFKNPISFNTIKKAIPRAHIEVAVATAQQNRDYCLKQNDPLLEQGDMPEQGKRNDIQQVIIDCKAGANMRKIIDKATGLQSIKVAEVWLKYNEQGKDWKPEVKWFHGSTGSGKSKAAMEWLGPDHYKPLTFKWWEGYDGHENVLLDEIRGDFCKYHEMLKLLDYYSYRVECKNGSRQLLAKKIAITSPFHPQELWNTEEDKQQLLRRIDEVILCGEEVKRRVRQFQECFLPD